MHYGLIKRLGVIALVFAAVAGVGPGILGDSAGATPRSEIEFEWVDVWVDTGTTPLAAWQFELRGSYSLTGVEGGGDTAYPDPPHYDPAALSRDRVIVGDFSKAVAPPAGRIKVATLHVMIDKDVAPDYVAELMAVADGEGRKFTATIEIERGR